MGSLCVAGRDCWGGIITGGATVGESVYIKRLQLERVCTLTGGATVGESVYINWLADYSGRERVH